MVPLIRYVDKIILRLTRREINPINQARVKILIYILFSYLLFAGLLAIAYFIEWRLLHFLRASFSVVVFFIVIKYTRRWKVISHVTIVLVTLAVWSNVLIFVQGANMATLQYIWLATVLSFYMHGIKWGWFYSVVNIFPVLIYIFISYSDYRYLFDNLQSIYDAKPVNQFVYLFIIIYNFLILIFLHHYFFRTFNLNIVNLTNTKNELNDLNKRLKASLIDVRKLSDARMDFLSTMSHELRTPLNGVIGISNALISQSPREDQKENLAILRFSAENLLSLINDILDFNKLDSDKMELERVPFNLADLIRKNCASLEMKVQEKMLAFHVSVSPAIGERIVLSDPTRLTQVLLNLLNNAIKFTEKGSVSLDTRILKDEGEVMTVRFTIEDTGIGIEPGKQADIFEAFTQASSSTNRHYGGTGLGLPIVKKVLGMFGSHVELASLPGEGTKIVFDIDFAYQAEGALLDHRPSITRDELKHLKVLVAEDNAINILVIRKTLEQWDIEPDIAENGLIALQKLEAGSYDVVLMDLYMPGMDGCEAAISIRSLPDKSKAATTIIALTATVNDSVIEKVFEAGMNDYLSKPFQPEHLFEKLQKYL